MPENERDQIEWCSCGRGFKRRFKRDRHGLLDWARAGRGRAAPTTSTSVDQPDDPTVTQGAGYPLILSADRGPALPASPRGRLASGE